MISSMVIPPNPLPNIIQIQRKNVTLSWEAIYFPSPEDKTKYGVNITICQSNAVLSGKSRGEFSQTFSLGDEKIPNCFVVVKERNDLIEIKNYETYEIDQISQLAISTTVYNLKSSTEYQIR